MRLAALFALLAVTIATELTQVDQLRQKFYNFEQDLWINVTDPLWRDSGLGGDVELTKAFTALNEHIESVPRSKRLQFKSWLWNKVSENLDIIDGYYKNFIEFVKRQASPASVPAPVREWLDLAESVLMDPSMSVSQAVRSVHGYLEHGDLFRSVLQDEDADVCDLQMSAHQLIFDMYNTIALTEIKGYAMMQFSWMLLRIYGRGNFTQEASLTRQRYAERTGQTATAARGALSMAKRELYRCNPASYNSDTYAEVTRLLQGYIENEVDMNGDGTCKENCAYYTLAENHGCFEDQFCTKHKVCGGRIIDCQFVDSDMWVCPATYQSGRRYEYIEYENGRVLGKGGSCNLGTTKSRLPYARVCIGGLVVALVILALFILHVPLRRCYLQLSPVLQSSAISIRRRKQQVDSWWKWNLYHCSYCLCLCEDHPSHSDRFFSLREAVADIEHNKVVTGIRLKKIGRVFHLQIHQGTLMERGFVQSSEEVRVQSFDPTNAGVVNGEDYHMLTYEKRAIDLDVLESPSGSVLTGVRFRMIGAHLHFEIQSTPFNYTTGKLFPSKSQWISNDNTEGSSTPRSRLNLHKPDMPTRGDKSLHIDSNHDQYIEFTNSDIDADAAQSTVPFIDIQPVLPSKASNSKGAMLNSGAGLYHRGASGSGGFIGVKLITYDYSKHVKAEPPPEDIATDDMFTTEINNKIEAH